MSNERSALKYQLERVLGRAISEEELSAAIANAGKLRKVLQPSSALARSDCKTHMGGKWGRPLESRKRRGGKDSKYIAGVIIQL